MDKNLDGKFAGECTTLKHKDVVIDINLSLNEIPTNDPSRLLSGMEENSLTRYEAIASMKLLTELNPKLLISTKREDESSVSYERKTLNEVERRNGERQQARDNSHFSFHGRQQDYNSEHLQSTSDVQTDTKRQAKNKVAQLR